MPSKVAVALEIWGLIAIYRLASNVSALIRINHYRDKYLAYRKNPGSGFREYTSAVVRLFHQAGVPDILMPFVQPLGYGQAIQANTTLFANVDSRDETAISNMLRCFQEARGVFKLRIRQCFSPLFWIECLIFLPRNALGYLGLSDDSVVTKLSQVVYWFLVPLLAILRDDLHQHILSLFQ